MIAKRASPNGTPRDVDRISCATIRGFSLPNLSNENVDWKVVKQSDGTFWLRAHFKVVHHLYEYAPDSSVTRDATLLRAEAPAGLLLSAGGIPYDRVREGHSILTTVRFFGETFGIRIVGWAPIEAGDDYWEELIAGARFSDAP